MPAWVIPAVYSAAKISVAGGYAHMWLAPSNPDWSTYSDENRIYQQVQIITKQGKVALLQRIRNEQRWQEIIVNNVETGENKFSNRVRYLISTTIPIFKNKKSKLDNSEVYYIVKENENYEDDNFEFNPFSK